MATARAKRRRICPESERRGQIPRGACPERTGDSKRREQIPRCPRDDKGGRGARDDREGRRRNKRKNALSFDAEEQQIPVHSQEPSQSPCHSEERSDEESALPVQRGRSFASLRMTSRAPTALRPRAPPSTASR